MLTDKITIVIITHFSKVGKEVRITWQSNYMFSLLTFCRNKWENNVPVKLYGTNVQIYIYDYRNKQIYVMSLDGLFFNGNRGWKRSHNRWRRNCSVSCVTWLQYLHHLLARFRTIHKTILLHCQTIKHSGKKKRDQNRYKGKYHNIVITVQPS